jgi:hypothetical protein
MINLRGCFYNRYGEISGVVKCLREQTIRGPSGMEVSFYLKKGSTPVTGAEPFLNFKIGYISL